MRKKLEKATFAGGCFWGVEKIFYETKGVVKTKVGYTGGKQEYKNPSYKSVCTDMTGHAEAVEIVFDSAKISYKKLLEVFWMIHDPTTPNRQGPDVGSQYRSVIFYHSEQQEKEALASRDAMQKKLGKNIVTEIVKADKFYPAEDYHQKYFLKHAGIVCHFNPYIK